MVKVERIEWTPELVMLSKYLDWGVKTAYMLGDARAYRVTEGGAQYILVKGGNCDLSEPVQETPCEPGRA